MILQNAYQYDFWLMNCMFGDFRISTSYWTLDPLICVQVLQYHKMPNHARTNIFGNLRIGKLVNVGNVRTQVFLKFRSLVPLDFEILTVWNVENVEPWKFETMQLWTVKVILCKKWKGKARKIWRSVWCFFFENLEYGINIFLKTWNGFLVILDTYTI